MSDVYQGLSGLPNFRCLGAADSGAITEAEAKLGLSFSKEYRSYLESCSFASVNGHELTGICKSPRLDVVGATRAERGNWPDIDPSWYVLERTGVDGIVAWQDAGGVVYFSIPGFGCTVVCDSLLEYAKR